MCVCVCVVASLLILGYDATASSNVLSTVDIAVQRRDGRRRLCHDDDDDDDDDTIRYDTRCYFNVRSNADTSQRNLPHGTDNTRKCLCFLQLSALLLTLLAYSMRSSIGGSRIF